MLSDFSVELGPDADALEIPWVSGDRSQRYHDLKVRPDLLLEIAEEYGAEAAEFLAHINHSPALQTAKCDVWQTTELTDIEEVFGHPWKHGSYADIFVTDQALQLKFDFHERLLAAFTAKLKSTPDFPAVIDFVLRRCYFHRTKDMDESEEGFCFTTYVSGFGADAEEAQRVWSIALQVAQNVLLQTASRFERDLQA